MAQFAKAKETNPANSAMILIGILSQQVQSNHTSNKQAIKMIESALIQESN